MPADVRVEAAAKRLREFWERHPDAMGPEPGDDPVDLSIQLAVAMLRAADEASLANYPTIK